MNQIIDRRAIASACGFTSMPDLMEAEWERRLAHRHDRELITAVWRRSRAAAGLGYRFELPPSLREEA